MHIRASSVKISRGSVRFAPCGPTATSGCCSTSPLKPTGGFAILHGNLAPEGAVAKITGKEGLSFSGPAQVFDCEEDMVAAAEQGKIRAGSVIVIRYEGPKGGPNDFRVKLQQAAAARDLAIENIYPRFKAQLCRRLGLSSRASAAEILECARHRPGEIREEDLRQALTVSEAALRGEPIDDAQLMQAVRLMRRTLAALGRPGRRPSLP